jgi:hypothetical protein
VKGFAFVLVAAILPLCCGGNDAPASADAGPVSIEEARSSGSGDELLVNGNLLAQSGEVRLCSALAESFPPQCGGPSLVVEGLDLDEVDGLVSEGDVSWTDRPIQLLGTVEDGLLTVSKNATG